MNIYYWLGIEQDVSNDIIEKDMIIENMSMIERIDGTKYFEYVDKIIWRLSIQRGEEDFLHVIEVNVLAPVYIERIAYLIQKTIKYRVLFIFSYQERYLLLWRNFKLTQSTDNVYTDSTTYCSDWIYEEYLNPNVISAYCARNVDIYTDVIPPHMRLKIASSDDGKAVLFQDILQNVCELGNNIISSDMISARALRDWIALHAIGERISRDELISIFIKECEPEIIDGHLFFDKNEIENNISKILYHGSTKYSFSVGRTGRVPMSYFEGIHSLATYDDEYEMVHRFNIRCEGGCIFRDTSLSEMEYEDMREKELCDEAMRIIYNRPR